MRGTIVRGIRYTNIITGQRISPCICEKGASRLRKSFERDPPLNRVVEILLKNTDSRSVDDFCYSISEFQLSWVKRGCY